MQNNTILPISLCLARIPWIKQIGFCLWRLDCSSNCNASQF